jgi:hypothetical protein
MPRACAHAASPTLRIKDSLAASIAFRVRAGRLERRPGKQRPDQPLDPNTQIAFVVQMILRISTSKLRNGTNSAHAFSHSRTIAG